MKLRRFVLGGYVIWWAVLVALYYGLPGLRAETWGLIGLSGAGGIMAGVVINRPSRKPPWLLLAAALTELYRRSGQLPRADADPGDPGPVSVLRGRAVPADLSAGYAAGMADFYLVAHARTGTGAASSMR